MNKDLQAVVNLSEVEELVARFFAHCEAGYELSVEKLPSISEDAQSLELAPPPDCVEWWSALPVAVQQKWLANPKTPTIYGAYCEHRNRLAAVNFARASVGLEGFKPSPESEALAVRFINGEIEFSEVIETKEQYGMPKVP